MFPNLQSAAVGCVYRKPLPWAYTEQKFTMRNDVEMMLNFGDNETHCVPELFLQQPPNSPYTQTRSAPGWYHLLIVRKLAVSWSAVGPCQSTAAVISKEHDISVSNSLERNVVQAIFHEAHSSYQTFAVQPVGKCRWSSKFNPRPGMRGGAPQLTLLIIPRKS